MKKSGSKFVKCLFFVLLILPYTYACVAQNQHNSKSVYIASPDVKGLEKGSFNELFKTILQGKLEEYALNSNYQAVAREEYLSYIQNEMIVQQSGGVSSESVVKLGELTGASYILISNVVASNGYGTIKLNLYETETGRLVKVKSTSFQENVSDYTTKSDRVCRDLFGLAQQDFNAGVERQPISPSVATPKNSGSSISIPSRDFMVSSNDENGFYTWEGAESICKSKGLGWRLPTLEELRTMSVFRDVIGNLNGYDRCLKYWSSEDKSKKSAWFYDFSENEVGYDDKKDDDKCVRCVRSR